MSRSRQIPVWAVAGCLCAVSSAYAQTSCGSPVGPDVIVGDMQDVTAYGAVGGIAAFSFGTTSCNMGNQIIKWVSTTREHPVIGQNLYRIKNGKFEQLGQSWLKHGFTALTGNVCCTCGGSGGSMLSPGCSDPYTAVRNGSQGNCGPKYAVNANNGFFPYPFTTSNASIGYTAPPAAPATIGRRLQVPVVDGDPAQNAGALYLIDTHYVTRDDAYAGNGLNNLSYRRIQFNSATSISFVSGNPTVRQKAAIEGWKDIDPSVSLIKIDFPETSTVPIPVTTTPFSPSNPEPSVQTHTARFMVGAKVTNLGGGQYQYSYAVMNVNSHRSASSFAIPLPCGVNVSNIEFRDVPYHSGEPHNNTDWAVTTSGNQVKWASTQTFSENQYANAIRWSTTYTMTFVANAAPSTGSGVIELFRPPMAPDTATSLNAPNLPVPGTPCRAEQDGSPGVTPADIAAFVNRWFDSISGGNLNGDFDCNGAVQPADVAQYVTVWSNAVTGGGC